MKTSQNPTATHCLRAIALVLAANSIAMGVSPESLRQGKELFEREWSSSSPAMGNDGLGPLFNAKSCVACHHQGGIGGGGDARFNAFAIGIERFAYTGGQSSNRNASKASLFRDFFPGFVQPDGTIRNTAPLPHRGGSPELDSYRQFFRVGSGAVLSDEGGPSHPAEVRVSLNTPIYYSKSLDGVSLHAEAKLFQRNTTPLFGAGLIDGISVDAIELQARIQRRHPEISGRTSILRDGTVGRFGWRANATNLVRFVDRACANELSLETKRRRQGIDPSQPAYRNPAVDISDDQINAMSHFISVLPRPIQDLPSEPEALLQVNRGSVAFEKVGCAVCHVPNLGNVSGLYSDLLLHDMGENLYDYDAAEPYVVSQKVTSDYRIVEGSLQTMPYYGNPTLVTSSSQSNVVPDLFVSPRSSQATQDYVTISTSGEVDRFVWQTPSSSNRTTALFRNEVGFDRKLKPSNTTQEWRTPPLWGVRDSAPYLHDGRAATLLEAIVLHDGESAGTRDRFLQLPFADREAVLAFMQTLVAPPDAFHASPPAAL